MLLDDPVLRQLKNNFQNEKSKNEYSKENCQNSKIGSSVDSYRNGTVANYNPKNRSISGYSHLKKNTLKIYNQDPLNSTKENISLKDALLRDSHKQNVEIPVKNEQQKQDDVANSSQKVEQKCSSSSDINVSYEKANNIQETKESTIEKVDSKACVNSTNIENKGPTNLIQIKTKDDYQNMEQKSEARCDSITSSNEDNLPLFTSPDEINKVDEETHLTAFEKALIDGDDKLAIKLINTKGFDLNNTPKHNCMMAALKLGYIQIADLLLSKGANPNIQFEPDGTLLINVLNCGFYDLAKKMVSHGLKINLRSKTNGWTALIWACIKGDMDAVDFLIENGADLNICCNDGWNALIGAYLKGHESVANKLIEAGANLNKKYLETALILSYKNGDCKTCIDLLKLGANPNCNITVSNSKEPLLVVAAKNSHTEIVTELLKAGANPNARTNEYKTTALMMAASNNNLEIIKKLIDHHADLNAFDLNGETALHYTVTKNSNDAAKVLLNNGIDYRIVNKSSKTARNKSYDEDNSCRHSILLCGEGKLNSIWKTIDYFVRDNNNDR